MANKFTRLIDKMFAEYSSAGTEDKILFANFHKGDEDGGCDEYDYTDSGEILECVCERDLDHEFLGNETLPDELCGSWDKEGPFMKDWNELTDMIWEAFREDINNYKYESTNCYWYKYYFITKDYKIYSSVERRLCEVSNEKLIVDLGALSEDAAEGAADKQTLSYIEEHVTEIFAKFKALKSDSAKEKAYKMIEKLPHKD
jgi:hypothetical protein